MKEIKELTGLYSLTKTIGVELKPVGKTQELIEARKLIEQDDRSTSISLAAIIPLR